MKNANLLHNHGFVDSQSSSTVICLGYHVQRKWCLNAGIRDCLLNKNKIHGRCNEYKLRANLTILKRFSVLKGCLIVKNFHKIAPLCNSKIQLFHETIINAGPERHSQLDLKNQHFIIQNKAEYAVQSYAAGNG